MKTRTIRRLAAALALCLLSGCAGPDGAPTPTATPPTEILPAASVEPAALPTEIPLPTETPLPTEEPENRAGLMGGAYEDIPRADGIHADVDFADMAWYLYDMTSFEAAADRLASTEDETEAEALYTWLQGEYARLKTLDELAWIDFYAYGTEADREACQATDEMVNTAGDDLYSAVSDALSGPLAGKFSAFVGEEISEALSGYEEMSDRELAIQNRETELQLEYNDLIVRRDLSDPEINYRAGQILLEMVSIRNEMAEIYGYDSFAEYTYVYYYGRDFTPADARKLSEAVKPYARRYFENCCYCNAFYADLGSAADRTPEELMDLLAYYAPKISPKAAEAQQYMQRHGLYLLGREGDIADLGYTTTLNFFNAPFLYNSLYGSVSDIQSMFHEFGHYYEASLSQPENLLLGAGSYDVFEIHSTALEALSYGWYDEIFGGVAEEARIYCLDGLIYNVITGCIYDEFQQYLYSHPDMTVEDINDVFAEIQQSYGVPSWARSDAFEWMYVNHNFESPFYYISYAVSSLAALQIWARANWDRDGTIALYNDLVSRGAVEMGYCELLREMGLAVFSEDGLDPCIKEAYETLEDMCLRYDSRSAAA